jgi:peptidoglycan/xylan/chitin deacetylase (PgdA/CDA1 family)
MAEKQVLLSFDVEEFDTPLDYGRQLPDAEQLEASYRGLNAVLGVLDRLGIRATFFTTAHYAQAYPQQVCSLLPRHEVASHGFVHGQLPDEDLLRSRVELERIVGRPVVGFRRARMADTDPAKIAQAGYRYNASENPTWIPGRYNNFTKPRRPYFTDELLNIPASVTPIIRFPLFWLSVKHFPMWWLRLASSRILNADGVLNLYFHPWEFIDLSGYGVPRLIRRVDGQRMLDRLEAYLGWLKEGAAFSTFAEFAEQIRVQG